MMMLRDKAVVTVEQIIGCKGLWDFLHSPAKLILLELVSAELDPSKEKVEETGLEKDTIKAYAHGVKEGGNVKYEAEFKGGKILGRLVRLLLRMSTTKKYFWRKYSLLVSQRVRLLSSVILGFTQSTTILGKESSSLAREITDLLRSICLEQSYLPSQTPSGLRALRKEELKVLRGNGKGERKWFERVYDYDVCNDIGDPDCDPSKTRPVLGGKGLPYLRRCRTGCPPCPRDHESEAKSNNVYVPRDECFSEVKQQKLREKTASSLLHPLIPSLRRRIIGFPNFAAIDQLFDEGMESPPQGYTSVEQF
ncbi:Lipoxygenase [Theobroma cacao]|nr:Lipoxygenase [Theobroma cacao]